MSHSQPFIFLGFGAFGQNAPQQAQQPQQQPQVNPMFGNLTSASTPSGGFGASRSVQPASSAPLSIPSNATGAFASTSTGAFGQPKPAFGGTGGTGAFGGGQPSAFGNTGSGGAFGSAGAGGAFGASGSGGSVFGQPAAQQQQNAFGGNNSLFGKSQSTGFSCESDSSGVFDPTLTFVISYTSCYHNRANGRVVKPTLPGGPGA